MESTQSQAFDSSFNSNNNELQYLLERKLKIADFAEQYNILNLPDEDICAAFHHLSSHRV